MVHKCAEYILEFCLVTAMLVFTFSLDLSLFVRLIIPAITFIVVLILNFIKRGLVEKFWLKVFKRFINKQYHHYLMECIKQQTLDEDDIEESFQWYDKLLK